ncbi:Immunogenic protein MPT70 precursor [Anaerohalosphaera lusitana]|uniref:Immunogenic protein MPT70 n=1 Tax=Anaerohalosphaera lusitana TaxID=1936003 RepID=A0A1U9NID6_9BACT|nr:CIA30 family protein [Anaerohalosphaera lusitana]AQT67693.1 Immunogenic protein MPT70 precursor [Anaerohalosphaera lusitana]
MRHLRTNAVILLITLFSLSTGIAAESSQKTLFDFTGESAESKWLSVNDTVMGGISEGRARVSEDNTLVFSGNLSLENQGGFASIRSKPTDLNLEAYEAFALRVRGDGRPYYFDIRPSSRNSATSYRATLKTQKDTWKEVRFPIDSFEYTTFGRRVSGVAPPKAGDIQSVGFTLSDKKAGPFRLEVASIRAIKTDAAAKNDKDIVETAVAAGQFETLVAALKAAGLVETLKGDGPFTVFAPTDKAFAKLPKGTVDELLKEENRDKLTAILTYHVLPSKILLASQDSETIQGQTLAIKTSGSFTVNNAKVITPDIPASNGVIHVIDSVLLPATGKKTPRQDAKSVIELAISRGVPVFNAGQFSACAAIYEVTVESLLKSNENGLREAERETLRNALRETREEESPREKAWILRRALDSVYRSLNAD